MSLLHFLKGAGVGFSIAAPVGPIGALCIRRTLVEGQATGLATGLGAATADAIYGAMAGFGLTAVTSLLMAQAGWLRLGGGVFLLYLGVKTYRAEPVAQEQGTAAPGLVFAYVSTLLLTLTNPTTILSFVAIFAGLGLGAAGSSYAMAALFVLGVFAGSALWWLILSFVVSRLRGRGLSLRSLLWVNRVSGVIIAGFGVAALYAAL
jgi:threonine/homoserine/homoserine lactone efflux protein